MYFGKKVSIGNCFPTCFKVRSSFPFLPVSKEPVLLITFFVNSQEVSLRLIRAVLCKALAPSILLLGSLSVAERLKMFMSIELCIAIMSNAQGNALGTRQCWAPSLYIDLAKAISSCLSTENENLAR